MIELSLRGFRLRATFSFFAVTGLAAAFDSDAGRLLCTVLLCSLLHEMGHIAAMCLFGSPPESLTLYAGGMMLPFQSLRCSKGRAAVILLAGAAVNYLAAAVCMAVGAREELAAVNLALGSFNLLPFRYFDGGRLIEELLGHEPPLILQLVSLLPLVLLAAYSLSCGQLPISLAAALLLIVSDRIINNGG